MDDHPSEPLIAQLLAEAEDIALVVSSLVGLCTGLLNSLDEHRAGTAEGFLRRIGLNFEKMTEENDAR